MSQLHVKLEEQQIATAAIEERGKQLQESLDAEYANRAIELVQDAKYKVSQACAECFLKSISCHRKATCKQ